MSHSVAKTKPLRHSVKGDAAAKIMCLLKIKVNLFYYEPRISMNVTISIKIPL